MFKFFKWAVLLRSNKSGFFVEPTPPGYLCRMANSDEGVIPLFGDQPSLYPFRYACFLLSELRRVGYNVSLVPYAFIALKRFIRILRVRIRSVRDSRRVWKK